MSAFGSRRRSGSARTTPAGEDLQMLDHDCAVCRRLATGQAMTMEEAVALMGGADDLALWGDDDDEAR